MNHSANAYVSRDLLSGFLDRREKHKWLDDSVDFVSGFMKQITRTAVSFPSNDVAKSLLADDGVTLKDCYSDLEFKFSDYATKSLNTRAVMFFYDNHEEIYHYALDYKGPLRNKSFQMAGRDFLFSMNRDPRSFWSRDFHDSILLHHKTLNNYLPLKLNGYLFFYEKISNDRPFNFYVDIR